MVNKKSKKKEANNKRQKVKNLVVIEIGGYLSMDEHLKIQQKIDSIIENFKDGGLSLLFYIDHSFDDD